MTFMDVWARTVLSLINIGSVERATAKILRIRGFFPSTGAERRL